MTSLSAKNREEAFPVHIELGKKETDMGGVMASPAPAGGKKGKSRTYYPELYIAAIPGLEQLPKEGCILVRYRRKRLSVDEGPDGKETTGVTLEIRTICLPEDVSDIAEGDDDGETLGSALDKMDRSGGKPDDKDEDDADEDGE